MNFNSITYNNQKRKYGFNVFHQQPEDRLEYAFKNGLRHIELYLSDESMKLESFTKARMENLLSLSESQNLRFSIHVPFYINIADVLSHAKKTSINYILKAIKLGAVLGLTHITLHMGSFYWFPVEKWERKKALKRFLKSLDKILPACRENHMVIALENLVPIPIGSEYHLLGDNLEDFKYIFSNTDSEYIKFCLDTGHANMAEGVMEYIKHFEDRLVCIHYHDNNGADDAHLPVGEGTVPWGDLAAELSHINYNGPIISECRNIQAHESAALFESYFRVNQIKSS